MSEEKDCVNVAVIGSGLAGLSAAYLLAEGQTDPGNKKIQVHLFEKNKSLGMDASSISVGPDCEHRIDVPMRSFMSGYYNHLFRLYEHLQIPIKKAKFSFGWYRIQSKKSFSDIQPEDVASHTENTSYLVYSGSRTVGQLDRVQTTTDSAMDYFVELGHFFWKTFIVAYSYLLLMIISLWMHHRGHLSNPDHAIQKQTLGEFFKNYHLHPFFVHEIFVPLFAAVCTNSFQSMLAYPATNVLEYMAVGLFQESFVVDCGVQQVVQNISKPLKNIHLGTQISEIKPTRNSHHRFELIDEKGTSYLVDHIIFATQGNQAISMLKSYYYSVKKQESDDAFTTWKSKQAVLDKLEEQIDMLKKFKYDRALVINHTDSRLLPNNKNNWKVLNLAMVDRNVDPGDCDMIVPFPHDTTMTTHILNMTHDGMDMDQGKLYMQTTNPCIAIDPKELLSVAWFERATVTLESKKALEECLFVPRTKLEQCQDQTEEPKLGPCQGENGIWFVGSYCWKGIPLLEGCVASAEHVVIRGIAQKEGIAMEKPW